MDAKTLDDLQDIAGKRILVRADLNVPVKDGEVTDVTRIERIAATVQELCEKGGRVILLSHFGRPKGRPDPSLSLEKVAAATGRIVGRAVAFAPDCVGPAASEAVSALADGEVLLLENTRFHPGEESNDPAFTAALAQNGDIFVNDAFSASHRAHASTEGIAHLLPAFAGRGMQAEIEGLDRGLGHPQRPVLAIVGGAKVSSKIDLLKNLVNQVGGLAIGGGMANTFLAAQGIDVGASLCEHELASTATSIIEEAERAGCSIILPSDAVTAPSLEAGVATRTVDIGAVSGDTMILDAGPATVLAITDWIDRAATLVWNGPVGAFEFAPFDRATVAIATHAAARTRAGQLVSVAGGGDTVAALNHAGVADAFSFVSTAGGAFLEWMEGKPLPGVDVLKRNRKAGGQVSID